MTLEILPLTVLFLAVQLVVVPWGAWTSRKAFVEGRVPPPGPHLYAMVIAQGLLLALLALGVAWEQDLALLGAPPPAAAWGWGALALAVMLGSLPLRWRLATHDERGRLLRLVPRKGELRGWWLATSLTAGIGEELVYRGVLAAVLERLTGSLAVAVLVAAALFAVGHAVQGWRAGVVIFAFALVFHGLVLVSGGLWVAMLVHFAYDLAAGAIIARLPAPPAS